MAEGASLLQEANPEAEMYLPIITDATDGRLASHRGDDWGRVTTARDNGGGNGGGAPLQVAHAELGGVPQVDASPPPSARNASVVEGGAEGDTEAELLASLTVDDDDDDEGGGKGVIIITQHLCPCPPVK